MVPMAIIVPNERIAGVLVNTSAPKLMTVVTVVMTMAWHPTLILSVRV